MAVLSRAWGYLYLMAPRTGCTATGVHLVKQFSGAWLPAEDVLDSSDQIVVQRKHSTVAELVTHGILDRAEVDRLLIFTAVRNPFDSLVSLWVKKRTTYQPLLRDPESFVNRLPGFAQDMEWVMSHSFDEWIEREYGHIDDGRERHLYGPFLDSADVVMRFERLQEDFARVMREVGVHPVEPIPLANRTEGRESDYRTYYGHAARATIERVFHADLERFGYRFDDPDAVAPAGPRFNGGARRRPTPPSGPDTGQTRRYCPACRRPAKRFEPGPDGRPDARCPWCNTLERHRALAVLLDRLEPFLAVAEQVLDVAPQARIQQVLRDRSRLYVGVDLDVARRIDVRGDLTRLPFADGAFGFVVAYHVLEHVPDDRTAIAELRRVLASGGVAVVQVPRRRGSATEEDPAAPPDERARRFGQDDHVRLYGDDFEDRLRAAGLYPRRVVPREFVTEDQRARWRIVADEEIWVCAPERPPRLGPEDAADEVDRQSLARIQALTGAVVRERARAESAEQAAQRLRHRLGDVERTSEGRRQQYEQLAQHPVVRTLVQLRHAARRGVRLARRIRQRL